MQRITELCLDAGSGLAPFAVLVEQGDQCAWATGADFGGRIHPSWAGHVLACKHRRPEEWWVLAAWRDWLAEVAQEPPGRRQQVLAQLARTTPGIFIKRPRVVQTRLPGGALAAHWRRQRLHDRAEVIGGEIAARLAGSGLAHWSVEVLSNDNGAVAGDWVVARRPVADDPGAATAVVPPEAHASWRLADITIIRVVAADAIDQAQVAWGQSREALGSTPPFWIAVVRHSRQAELIAAGCIVGERFPAAVSLAVAASRAYWRGA